MRLPMSSGPNLFIWIAIALVAASTIPAWYGHGWVAAIGWPIAVALAVLNKVRAIPRRPAAQVRNFD